MKISTPMMPMPEAEQVVVLEEEQLDDDDDDEPEEAHEQDAAEAGEVALRDPAVDRGAAEDRGCADERRHDAREADLGRVREHDDADHEAHRERVDEEQRRARRAEGCA